MTSEPPPPSFAYRVLDHFTYGYDSQPGLKIYHRGLGCLHLLLQIGVLAYVILQIIVGQQFVVLETPTATVNVWADNQYQSYIRSNVSELDYCNPAITKNWNVSFPGGFEIHDFQCVRRDSSQVVYLAPNEIDVMTFIAEQDTVNGSITGDMRPRFVIDAEYVKWNFGVAWSTSFANSHMVNMEILDADDHRFRQSDDGAFFGLTFADLVALAGKSLNDTNKQDWFGASVPSDRPKYRMTGMVIMVSVEFFNLLPFSLTILPPSARMRATAMSRIWGVVNPETLYARYPNSFSTVMQSGIRVVFHTTGQLATFSLHALILNFVSGIVLLSAANSIVDFLAPYVVRDPALKAKYQSAKEQEVFLDDTRVVPEHPDEAIGATQVQGMVVSNEPFQNEQAIEMLPRSSQIDRLIHRIRPSVANAGDMRMISARSETYSNKSSSAAESDVDARIAEAVAQAKADAEHEAQSEAKVEIETKVTRVQAETEQRVRAEWEQAGLEELLRQLTPELHHGNGQAMGNDGLLVTKFDSGNDKADYRWLFVNDGIAHGSNSSGLRLCWRKLDSKSISFIDIDDISLAHSKSPDPKRAHLPASVSLQLKASVKKDRSDLHLLFASQQIADRFLKLLERLQEKTV